MKDNPRPMIRRCHSIHAIVTALVAPWILAPAHSANQPLDTVVVQGTRDEQVRREIQTFVHKLTRLEGEFVGRWDTFVCPLAVGVSDAQAQFIQRRIVEVQNSVRRKQPKADAACYPNLFIIITDEAEQVLADWKERDPGMFRWKSRDGVSRSGGTGPVRTWHNAIVENADGRGQSDSDQLGLNLPSGKPSCGLHGRIEAGCWEHITAVVVLVDARAAGKATLAQLADFISVVSLSQIDLSADLGSVDSILRLFAASQPEDQPAGLTHWDYAFLRGLYRVSYSPMNQQRDIAARMVRELAPR
jgi:hypothetical protein